MDVVITAKHCCKSVVCVCVASENEEEASLSHTVSHLVTQKSKMIP